MSDNGKLRRAQRAAKQEKQAKGIIKWIFIALIILAVAFAIYSMTLV
jgi:flagellar basal body-associated protein FliL